MTQRRTPAPTMSANNRCKSGASGVVRSSGTLRPLTVAPTVPISPVRSPKVRKMLSIMNVVVVLPLVPVTPIKSRRFDGSP